MRQTLSRDLRRGTRAEAARPIREERQRDRFIPPEGSSRDRGVGVQELEPLFADSDLDNLGADLEVQADERLRGRCNSVPGASI